MPDKARLGEDLSADAALKRVLRRLLRAIESNERGVVRDASGEPLHDFRVAVRQARVLLSQFAGVLPAKTADELRRRFAWLASSTAPLRDLDVHLERFDALRAALPEHLRGDLDPLRAFLAERRAGEFARLAKTLRSPRYRRLKTAWRRAVDAPPASKRTARRAAKPVGKVVRKRMRKACRRVVKKGAALTPRSPDEALHELRKDCKKLRYLIQLFRDICPPRWTRRLLEDLVSLQDSLGAHQDAHVQLAALSHFEREMRAAGVLAPRTRRAMAALRRALKRRQKAARAEFGERFDHFARVSEEVCPARRHQT